MEVKPLGPGFCAEVRGVGLADAAAREDGNPATSRCGTTAPSASRPAVARRQTAAHDTHHDLGHRGGRPRAQMRPAQAAA